MKNSIWVVAGLLLLTMMGCKPTVPSDVISPGKMEDILYDYHVAQAMGKQQSGEEADYNKMAAYHAVLRKHHITEAEFDSSLVYYYSRIDYLKDIYSHVNDRLANEATALGAITGDINRYSQYSEDGDTANIWRMPTDLMLIPRPTMNRFDFTITPDTTFRKGDAFMFQFMSEYIAQGGGKDAVACLVAVYEGDSILQTVSHVSMGGTSQLRIPSNTEKELKKLKGYIYFNEGGERTDMRKMMFVSQLQLIRFHNKELPKDSAIIAKDSLQADSVPQVELAAGERIDTLRRRNLQRSRDVVLPAERRAAHDGVDDRDHHTKK